MPNGKITQFGPNKNIGSGTFPTYKEKPSIVQEVENTPENRRIVGRGLVPIKTASRDSLFWVNWKNLD